MQFRDEVAKELEDELEAETEAMGVELPDTTVRRESTPKSSTDPSFPVTTHTFASIARQAKPAAARPPRKRDAPEAPAEAAVDDDARRFDAAAGVVVFPPDVLAHETRRKMVSLLLRALRGHLDDRHAAHAAAQRAQIPPPNEFVPVRLLASQLGTLATQFEAALYNIDATCEAVRLFVALTWFSDAVALPTDCLPRL